MNRAWGNVQGVPQLPGDEVLIPFMNLAWGNEDLGP